MARNFEELENAMPPERRARAKERAKRMIVEMLLSELRSDAGLTQKELAGILDIKQPSLSKLENRDDMQISTLRRIIQALGGELEIIAHMPKGDIRIRQFAD